MRTARRANRKVSMRGGAPFAPKPGDIVSFYKRNDGIRSWERVGETNSTLETGTYKEFHPGGSIYIIRTDDGKEHMSKQIGDIPEDLIGEMVKVRLAATYGRPFIETELTVTGIKPYDVYGVGPKEYIYTGKEGNGVEHEFFASDIIEDLGIML